MSSADLLRGHGLGGKPQGISTVAFEPVLSSDCQDCQKQFGGNISRQEGWKMQKGEVLMEPADVSFEESGKSVARGEHKVVGEDRRKLIKSILDGVVVRDGDAK